MFLHDYLLACEISTVRTLALTNLSTEDHKTVVRWHPQPYTSHQQSHTCHRSERRHQGGCSHVPLSLATAFHSVNYF